MFRAVLLVLVTVVFTMSMEAAVKVEKIEYKGWKNCYRVATGEIEFIVIGDVGPRINNPQINGFNDFLNIFVSTNRQI
jgi:hypothetical protein